MERFTFPPAPKTYRKVKTVKHRLCGPDGVEREHEVPVYMHAGGTPTFCVYVPEPYRGPWVHHRSSEHSCSYSDRIFVVPKDGWLHAASFDQAMQRLDWIGDNFRRFMANRSMRKVIAIYVELKADGGRIDVNKVSFAQSRTYVGIRADVRYEVLGKLYYDSRRPFRVDDTADAPEQTDPAFEDLHPADREGNAKHIPFTDAAWAAVCDVVNTLERAAKLLKQLNGDEAQVQALLESGMRGLLTGPSDPPKESA